MKALDKLKKRISFEELAVMLPEDAASVVDEESILALEECFAAHEKIVTLAETGQLDKITFDDIFSNVAGHLKLENDVTPSFEADDGEPTKENFIKASLKKLSSFFKDFFSKLRDKFKKKTEENTKRLNTAIAEMKKLRDSDKVSMEAFSLFGGGGIKSKNIPNLTLPNGKLADPTDVISALKYGFEKIAPAAYDMLTSWEEGTSKGTRVEGDDLYSGTMDGKSFDRLRVVCDNAGKPYDSKKFDHFIGNSGLLVTFCVHNDGVLLLFLINHVRLADRYGDKVVSETITLTPEMKAEWNGKLNGLVDDMVKLGKLATNAVNDANKGLDKVEKECYKVLSETYDQSHGQAARGATIIRNSLLERSTHIVQFYGSLQYVTSTVAEDIKRLCK